MLALLLVTQILSPVPHMFSPNPTRSDLCANLDATTNPKSNKNKIKVLSKNNINKFTPNLLEGNKSKALINKRGLILKINLYLFEFPNDDIIVYNGINHYFIVSDTESFIVTL